MSHNFSVNGYFLHTIFTDVQVMDKWIQLKVDGFMFNSHLKIIS